MKKHFNVLVCYKHGGYRHYKNLGQLYIHQTQNAKGKWNNCFYTTDVDKGPFDFIINLGGIEGMTIYGNPENIMSITGDPYLGWLYRDLYPQHVYGYEHSRWVLTDCTHKRLKHKRIMQQRCEPWYIGKTYPELIACDLPKKQDIVVWVTSNNRGFPIHTKRMFFLDYIQKHHPDLLQLYGEGFEYVNVKWDVLSPAKYIVAIENTTNAHAWTEKLADAFLAYGLPIYYGTQGDELSEYFPKQSYILMDINKPKQAVKIIEDAIQNNEWQKRLPAIIEARRRVLEEHNFAPWMTKFINENYVEGTYQHFTIEKMHIPKYIKVYAGVFKKCRKSYLSAIRLKGRIKNKALRWGDYVVFAVILALVLVAFL